VAIISFESDKSMRGSQNGVKKLFSGFLNKDFTLDHAPNKNQEGGRREEEGGRRKEE
jgi:hypothetical protein